MNKMYLLLASLVLLSGCCVMSCAAAPSVTEVWDIKKQSIEETAPEFTLKNIEGKKVSLSDFKGKTVLLVFGTTWCPYCVQEIPRLKKLYSEHKDKGLEIVSIDIQESIIRVSAFAKKHSIPYPVLLDVDGEVAYKYKVRGVPTKILVGKNGKILCRECRSVDIFLKKELNIDDEQ